MDSELTRKPIVTMAVIILKPAMISEGAIAKEGDGRKYDTYPWPLPFGTSVAT